MGDRLIASQHYAEEQIRAESQELEERWEGLRGVIEERVELFDLSVSFHENQHKVVGTLELMHGIL